MPRVPERLTYPLLILTSGGALVRVVWSVLSTYPLGIHLSGASACHPIQPTHRHPLPTPHSNELPALLGIALKEAVDRKEGKTRPKIPLHNPRAFTLEGLTGPRSGGAGTGAGAGGPSSSSASSSASSK